MHSQKVFILEPIVPGLFGRRGERDLLSLKKQNSGAGFISAGMERSVCYYSQDILSADLAPRSTGFATGLPNPHRARGLALQLLEKEYPPPAQRDRRVIKTSFLIGK